MDAQYWIDRWNEGKTGFHQEEFHRKLVQYSSSLIPMKTKRALVPLCGKSKDLIWLDRQGFHVHGVELFEPAVKAFFEENQILPFERKDKDPFIDYSSGKITVSCGDFFSLGAEEEYDFVYDRAALVALPKEMRPAYVDVIRKAMKKGAKCLLIVYEYDQALLEGPPFSISDEEIQGLYHEGFSVRLLESEAPQREGPRMAALPELLERVYELERI